MNRIELCHVGKRYGYQWIVRDLNTSFDSNLVNGISGANGSGKSTIMKILSGHLSPSQGQVIYHLDNQIVKTADIYRYISMVAPYTDLVQEYSLSEMFDFHCAFKDIDTDIDYKSFVDMLDMQKTGDKHLHHFSSGMKQKIQLALAFVSTTPFLLLDEPTSYLDLNAKAWFSNLLRKYKENRCVIIASNDTYDLDHCQRILSV
jgi:ABC-type multidrug transport system ATPase subunit